jgi:hypothetical protein
LGDLGEDGLEGGEDRVGDGEGLLRLGCEGVGEVDLVEFRGAVYVSILIYVQCAIAYLVSSKPTTSTLNMPLSPAFLSLTSNPPTFDNVFHHHPANTTFRPAPPKCVHKSTCQPNCLNNNALIRLKKRADSFMQLRCIKINVLNLSLEVHACMLSCTRLSKTACQVNVLKRSPTSTSTSCSPLKSSLLFGGS